MVVTQKATIPENEGFRMRNEVPRVKKGFGGICGMRSVKNINFPFQLPIPHFSNVHGTRGVCNAESNK